MFEYKEEYRDKEGRIEMILLFRMSDECIEEIARQEWDKRDTSLRKKVKDYEVIFENDNVGIYWTPEEYDLIKVITDRVRTYSAADLAMKYGLRHCFYLNMMKGNRPDVQVTMQGGTVEGTIYKKLFDTRIMVNLYNGKGHFEYLNGEMLTVEDFMSRFQGDIKYSDPCFVACFPKR